MVILLSVCLVFIMVLTPPIAIKLLKGQVSDTLEINVAAYIKIIAIKGKGNTPASACCIPLLSVSLKTHSYWSSCR